jgi:hypothetical protein
VVDDEDFRALIAELAARFRAIGADDLADQENYLDRSGDATEPRMLSPRARLIAMLRAFNRFLMVRDRVMYDDAMQRLRESVQGEAPVGALVVPTDEGIAPSTGDLSEAPDLSAMRADLQGLIEALEAERSGPLTEAP